MAQTEIPIKQERGGVLTQIATWFNSLLRQSRTFLMRFGTREVIPDIDARRAIENGFNANAAVYTIIKDDADKFASIPRYVYDAKSLQSKARKDYSKGIKLMNDLSKLLERPNPYEGQAAFFKKVRAYFQTCGEAFIWLNRGDIEGLDDTQISLMPIIEMYALPSDKMKVVPDESLFGITGYILEAGGQSLPIRKGDIIHWKNINLDFDATSKIHLRGMPPLRPGAPELQQNNDAGHSATRMYQNDGSKGILYGEETKGITPTQEGQIRAVVDKKVNNNDIKGAVATIMGAGKLGYLDLGGTSVDLQLLEGKKMSKSDLAVLFGNPPEFYDTSTTFSNKEWAQKNWVSNKIIPASKELDDELNRMLLRPFKLEGKAIIACDYSDLPEMQADYKSMTEWLMKAWPIVPNEVREALGYEKNPDPLFDEPWVPQNVVPLSQSQGDGFDQMANQLGLSDYSVPKPSSNGTAAN